MNLILRLCSAAAVATLTLGAVSMGVTACSSSNSPATVTTTMVEPDGATVTTTTTTSSAAQTACATFAKEVAACANATACDKAESDSTTCLAEFSHLNDSYIEASANCAYECPAEADGATTPAMDMMSDECAQNAMAATTPSAAYNDFATTFCQDCPTANCAALFATDNDANAATFAGIRIFSDAYIAGLKAACVTGPIDGGAASCLETFSECFGNYDTTTFGNGPAACQDTSGGTTSGTDDGGN